MPASIHAFKQRRGDGGVQPGLPPGPDESGTQVKSIAFAFAMICSLGVHAAEPVLIGQSAPLTGPAAAAGKAFVDGAKACIDDVNLNGGVRGRHIELRTLDDAYDPKR